MVRPAPRGHHRQGAEELLPGRDLGRRDAEDLVALAAGQLGQIRHRKDQQVPGVGDGRQSVLGRVGDRDRRQDPGPRGEAQDRLAGLGFGVEVLQADDEAVARIRGQEQALPRLAGQQGDELGPRPAGSGARSAARPGRGPRAAGVPAPSSCARCESRKTTAWLLRTWALARKPIPGLVTQRPGVQVVALGGAHPALLGQDHGHRFAGGQLGLVQGAGGGALHQGRAAGIAVLRGIGLDLLADQVT